MAAHRKIVSLDIREAPLSVVLKKIEWQTWERIRAEQGLDSRITLRVVDEPLTDVLDRIAQQVGARWSTVFAVYDSAKTLALLDRRGPRTVAGLVPTALLIYQLAAKGPESGRERIPKLALGSPHEDTFEHNYAFTGQTCNAPRKAVAGDGCRPGRGWRAELCFGAVVGRVGNRRLIGS